MSSRPLSPFPGSGSSWPRRSSPLSFAAERPPGGRCGEREHAAGSSSMAVSRTRTARCIRNGHRLNRRRRRDEEVARTLDSYSEACALLRGLPCKLRFVVTIERTRYCAGQRLDDADLTQEQLYFREKARRHNRMLHGWGIVCGLRVRPGAARGELIVESGYALDPYGDEVVVE